MSDDAAKAEKVELSKEEKAVIDALEKLNVVQLNNVVKFMESEYGISAAAPVAVAAAGAPAGGADAGGAEEKSSYDVEVTEAGGQKIAVIKVVREITGLALGEAKAAVDSAPKVVKEGVPAAEAEAMKKKLEEAGAKVTLK
ncbi:50S ribosomal protein L7/L12 [Candidatus Peregrinibacteria bacterium CG10_big_fil_rev_8_21_14_0_10_49_24]|nr:MAG: 50S ribosomal protein L7/L12 [Candidatus Peregrinibacteria bacterium CG11_big_fil_rev_8_21_14_0_20_49_14]PIR50871.1 MAG: 50S ribosomal protein L7/L12 [Candidatus Peregrinibacteria bacterium CG10_big_fil_rev_8_21_14_0_10_49_24]PJA67148.1 MAG: 50S ribosomal protein L7/L12 [Candidatus Peregrinibacteria bacterium CG_4_9_14_3_um_filter_49_12]